MIFTSDAVYMKASYGPPPVGAAIVWDNQAWLRSVDKLRGIAERTDATLVFGHDPDQWSQLRFAPEGSYT
jgi:glyoxylase-like metal-dependent hydrolase (beta-lactamase superfamily II)